MTKKHLSQGIKYMHMGQVQVAATPLTRQGLNVSTLLCLRDGWHNQIHNSLLGIVEASLYQGQI